MSADFKELLYEGLPCWILAITIILAVVFAGRKDVLRVDKKALWCWFKFLCATTLIRILIYSICPSLFIFNPLRNASWIQWEGPFFVFWEDATHGLPLFFLEKACKGKKMKILYNIILAIFMVEFGLGHTYQGILPAIALSMYIPLSIRLGEMFGFGTVMIGHTMFDVAAMIFMKIFMKI